MNRRAHLGDFKRWINSSRREKWYEPQYNGDTILTDYFEGNMPTAMQNASFADLQNSLRKLVVPAKNNKYRRISMRRIRNLVADNT